jgi:peroxiredoxin
VHVECQWDKSLKINALKEGVATCFSHFWKNAREIGNGKEEGLPVVPDVDESVCKPECRKKGRAG